MVAPYTVIKIEVGRSGFCVLGVRYMIDTVTCCYIVGVWKLEHLGNKGVTCVISHTACLGWVIMYNYAGLVTYD